LVVASPTEEEGFKMNVIHRIALPCGIVGGIWGLLAPILVLLPITVRVAVTITEEPGEREMVSWYEMGMAGEILSFLSFIALMGLLGLLAIVLHKRSPYLGRIFIWISALAILGVSLVSIFSLGLFFLPASILLIVSAMGLREPGGE